MNTESIKQRFNTPLVYAGVLGENQLYIKREDLIPYSFGGNKARKGFLFFEDIDRGDYSCVVTYGSSHSNHCRIIANMAAERKMPCYIVGPEEVSDTTYNSRLMELFHTRITTVPVSQVHNTIENLLNQLKTNDMKPYFIQGGGHGNIGTQAYVNCYEEIKDYELSVGVFFDYIFFASGTGTTQAGLVCGQIKHNDKRKIVGISIARKNPRGRDIVLESIRAFMPHATETAIQENTIFLDQYTGDGYGKDSINIADTIQKAMCNYGIPLDSTYTAKAFWGMERYINCEKIAGKNILFVHTGGTPLFFDDIQKISLEQRRRKI